MNNQYDVWKMLAGISFLLLAMNFMEDAMRLLAGRSFKLFLKKQVSNKIKAIGGAAIVTGLLQSSSIVNLMVLNMVGAGVVKMENALALIMGANLGTTFDSWIVAIFGFNYNIETLVLPIVAITGIGMAFLNIESKWYLWFKFLFSLAFLFVALGFIKTGMEAYVKQTDLSSFNQYPIIVFTLVGIVLTAIIQSSSATIVLTLSALHTMAITPLAAMAVVLGSEIGTTFKLFLVTAKGIPAKKRVALANFIFNTVAVTIMFFLLRPTYFLIVEIFKIENNLIAIVFFQTFLNLSSILLFFPFLKLMGGYLMGRYTKNDIDASFIRNITLEPIGKALAALEKESKQYLRFILNYCFDSFEIAQKQKNQLQSITFSKKSREEKYEYLKHLHGEMHRFSLELQSRKLEINQRDRLLKIISANRNFMYAAKNIHDIQHDLVVLRNSSNNVKYNFYLQTRKKLQLFIKNIVEIISQNNKENVFSELKQIYDLVADGYPETLKFLYKENLANHVTEIEISTLINFNREVYTSFKSILYGLKDLNIEPDEGQYFDNLPGFIR